MDWLKDESHFLTALAILTLCAVTVYLAWKGTPIAVNDFGYSFTWISGGGAMHSALKGDGIQNIAAQFTQPKQPDEK